MLQTRLLAGFLLLAFPAFAQIPGATYTAVATEPTIGHTPAGESRPLALSANGRYLLFSSPAPNVLVGQFDPNGDDDLFLHDLVVGDTQLVSRAFASPLRGAAGDLGSSFLTPDGGKVLFTSDASDILAPGVDTNLSSVEGEDVFEYDRVTRTNTLVTSRWDDPSRPAEFGARLGAVTPDRRFLLIESSSPDLIAGFDPVPVTQHVFLFDRTTGSRRLITHAAGQPQTGANGYAVGMALSSDGRYLLFASNGFNLVPGYSSNGRLQLFRYDTVTQTAQLVSRSATNPAMAADGEVFLGARISPNGRWVLFSSSGTNLVAGQVDPNSLSDLFLFDADTGVNTLVNHLAGSPVTTSANGSPGLHSFSDDGRFVVYVSAAPDLVAGAVDTNGTSDAFLFDRTSGQNRLLSHVPSHPLQAANGLTDAQFEGDLRHIVFSSEATDLGVTDTNGGRDLFLYDATSSTLRLVSRSEASPLATGNLGTSSFGALAPILDRFLFSSPATDHVSGVDDRNGAGDLFSFQLSTGTVSALAGTLPAPVVPVTPKWGTRSAIPSANGRFVLFSRTPDGILGGQVWLLDRQSGQSVLVSHAFGQPGVFSDDWAAPRFVTDDGRYVVFESAATNLIPNFVHGGDYFPEYLYDRSTGRAELLGASATNPNQPTSGSTYVVHLSPDGRYAYLWSEAPDLLAGFVPSGPNDIHLFLRDRVTGTTILVDHAPGLPLTAANGSLLWQRFSPDGRFVALNSLATNLVPGVSDLNGISTDTFFYDRLSGNVELLSSAAGSPNTTANASTEAAGVSADGRFVLLWSGASNLAAGVDDTPRTNDVYLRDRVLGVTELISHHGGAPLVAAGSSFPHSLSEDGRFVLFQSSSPLLVPTNPPVSDNVYLYDRANRSTTRVSSSAYDPLDGGLLPARAEALSATGRYVLFSSQHSRFVSGFSDRNGNELDLFLYDHGTGRTFVVSHPPHAPDLRSGDRGVLDAYPLATISRNGNVMTFETLASNFLVNDTNFLPDVVIVSTEIFVDGFESGNVSRWSVVVP